MSRYNPFNSTIFNKVVMAITGLILVGFIVGHALGNLQVFLGREVFNTYAHFLQSAGELLWIVRLVLIVSVALHIITSLRLKFLNMAAKPEGYSVKGYIKSTIYSRSMIYTGLFVLLFLVYHLLHFTAHMTNPEYAGYEEGYGPKLQTTAIVETESGPKEINAGDGLFVRHDAYKMVVVGFSQPIISIVYILAVFFLGLHLSHAVQSMFQTLGFNGPKLTPSLIALSKVLGWGVFIMFASIPAAVLFLGLGKGVLGI